MGVASRCGEQEVGVASGSGWNLWVWLLGVVVRRYIDLLILLIPTPLVSVLFCSSIPTFCSFLKMFFVLVPVLFKNYILGIFFFSRSINTYRQLRATHGIHMKAAHTRFIHEEAHTNVRFLSCDGHHLYELAIDLEVEGVRYIEMHRGPAAYVLGPPPSRSRDLELEGGVIACHVDYVYEPQDSHVRGTE